MPKLPKATKPKELPPMTEELSEMPDGFTIKTTTPEESQTIEETPKEPELKNETPESTEEKKDVPEDPNEKDLPPELNEENCVEINGEKIEIKPTKLKYFRNKAASGYGIIKAVPVHELLTYGKGVLDPDRDADELVYDFLVAAFNDAPFVRKNYNEMDSEVLDRVCKIFGRINHIDEKEEAARKNREAQAQAKR